MAAPGAMSVLANLYFHVPMLYRKHGAIFHPETLLRCAVGVLGLRADELVTPTLGGARKRIQRAGGAGQCCYPATGFAMERFAKDCFAPSMYPCAFGTPCNSSGPIGTGAEPTAL